MNYAKAILERRKLPDGQFDGALYFDLVGALEVKVRQGGMKCLNASERLIHSVYRLDEMAGSDPGFDGYLKSEHADDWVHAFEGLRKLGATGYRQIAEQVAGAFGGHIPATRTERVAAIKALDRKDKRLLGQLSTIWWEHNVQNAVDEEDIRELPAGERGDLTITMKRPDGQEIVVDPADSDIPGVASIMKAHKKLMSDAAPPPRRERGIELRLIDYFVANVEDFSELPMSERDAQRAEAEQSAANAIAAGGSAAAALLALCSTPSPWIYASSYDAKPRRVKVGHLVGAPADAAVLAKLRKRLGAVAKGPEAFYGEVNGALLMRSDDFGKQAFPLARVAAPALTKALRAAWAGKGAGSGGFALYPVELWDESTTSLREWYEALMEAADEDESEDYPWLEHATSIGQVLNSADHFVLVSSGHLAGKVLFTDHETLEATVFAQSFEQFIGLIAGAPTWFLQRVLSDWRFDDGLVPEAWMEERILSQD